MNIGDWYKVTFDETQFRREVSPPGSEAWSDAVAWTEIFRVCYKTTAEFWEHDELYIFTRGREESYVIPTEATGGTDLMGELIRRGLFDARLAIEAATSGGENLYCWPKD